MIEHPILTKRQDRLHEAIVNLSHGLAESNLRLGPNIHSNASNDEIILVERIALEDPSVKAEIAKLQLPEGTVVISDPWIYGSWLLILENSVHGLTMCRLRWRQRRSF